MVFVTLVAPLGSTLPSRHSVLNCLFVRVVTLLSACHRQRGYPGYVNRIDDNRGAEFKRVRERRERNANNETIFPADSAGDGAPTAPP